MARPEDATLRQRGRPRDGSRANVHDDLLRAMRLCLAERMYGEITLKDVAERANTSQEMVRYYFGSKDGLLIALLRQMGERTSDALASLEKELPDGSANPTRQLIATLLNIYLEVRHLYRSTALEFQRSQSVIRNEFLDERAELVVSGIHRIISRLIAAGNYAADVDSRKMAVSIMTMISGPVTLLSTLPEPWVSVEGLASPEWVDHLTELVDRRCRPASDW